MSTLSLTPALDGGGWLAPRPGRLNRGRKSGIQFTGGWVDPGDSLEEDGKSRRHQGAEPCVVQFVAIRYTDYTIET